MNVWAYGWVIDRWITGLIINILREGTQMNGHAVSGAVA
jgi:hypothetical protein